MTYYPFPPTTYPVSRHKNVLEDTLMPADAAYFMHEFDGYALEARILYNAEHARPWILSIHGARADYTKNNIISIGLQQRGYSVLGMNMSGHSKASAVPLEQTSLAHNVAETEAFFGYLDPNRPKALIAYSLGGTPALKVLGEHLDEINKLILCYPGIYSAEAYTQNYGEPFRKVLHVPYSYRDNDTLAILEQFKGDVLVVKGEYDGLDPEAYGKPAGGSAGEVMIDGVTYYSPIPKEVFEMITAAVPESRRQLIEIPKCGHAISPWMRDHPAEAEAVLDKFGVFLKS
jgi:pimeloyl-ACP methyl ester carboxylesterase